MTSMNFVLRPSVRKGHHPGSLSLRVIHHRDVKTVTLAGCKIYPEEWDTEAQRVIYPENNPVRLEELTTMEHFILSEKEVLKNYQHILEKQGRYRTEDLIKLYRQKKDNSKIMGYAETLAIALERGGQNRTAAAYRTVTRGLIRFNKGEDIPLTQINGNLMKEFEIYLKAANKKPNTISYYMRNLRAIFNKAVKNYLVDMPRENPFAGVFTGTTKTMKRALSLEEITQIHDLDFDEYLAGENVGTRKHTHFENLSRSRRYFLFCFYTRGMSFVDLTFLKKENIKDSIISYTRRKTGQQIEVRVADEIQKIIDSFAGEVKSSPYVFPIIREEEGNLYHQYEKALRSQNTRLKKVAKIAGIDKPVSTHQARHTWATIAKYKNIPVPVISDSLGHSDEKTTRIYLDLMENSVLDAANELIIAAVARRPGK